MEPEVLFYDGECGLCHGAVKFTLQRDRDGSRFRFAPLQGETFARSGIPRDSLPDSFVIRRADGAVLTRSAAVIHLLRRLGGLWALLAALSAAVPAKDALYDWVARNRKRWFPQPAGLCPLLPPNIASRFLP